MKFLRDIPDWALLLVAVAMLIVAALLVIYLSGA